MQGDGVEDDGTVGTWRPEQWNLMDGKGGGPTDEAMTSHELLPRRRGLSLVSGVTGSCI